LIFIITLLFGWISGIFKNLRHRPKFIIDIIPIPTFCSVFETGNIYKDYKATKTALVVYLKIKNIGTAPSEIEKIQVGYHNDTFKYTFLWFWLDTIIALKDFGHKIGNNGDVRYYPFLIQKNITQAIKSTNYLECGKSVNGIVHFEQHESYGGSIPKVKNNKVKIKIKVFDVYNSSYGKVFWIPIVDLEYAHKFNEKFGESLKEIQEGNISILDG
jgi:hypothetical protein